MGTHKEENNKRRGPGRSWRRGVSLIELLDRFPDEASAVAWFERTYWPDGRACGHCGSMDTKETPNRKPMPYRCRDCGRYFSVSLLRGLTPSSTASLKTRRMALARMSTP